MADVFLSYAREDRDRAKALTGALEAAGLSVWWDRDLVPGPSYDDAIERELNGASCVLVLWSSRSIRSDWVKDEAEAGKARGVLINVLLDDVQPPLGFRRHEAANLAGWDGQASDGEFQRLLLGVSRQGESRARADASDARESPPRSPGAKGGGGSATWALLRRRPAVTGVVGSLIAAYVAFGLDWSSPERTTRNNGQVSPAPSGNPPAVTQRPDPPDGPASSIALNPDAWFLPDEPLLGFSEIPDGAFLMGGDDTDPMASAAEKPQWKLSLPRFYASKYEVTVAQFRAFLEATGASLEHRGLQAADGHPVTFVTWHEATAYCEWLTDTLRGWPETPEPISSLLGGASGAAWQVRLPTEPQWEKSARGLDGRRYPWGNTFVASRVNVGTPGTVPVGWLKDATSPYGLLEASGNVWEWTRSLWGDMEATPRYIYPYDPTDGREDPGAPDAVLRVVRGGGYLGADADVRLTKRGTYDPVRGTDDVGFRLVIAEAGP